MLDGRWLRTGHCKNTDTMETGKSHESGTLSQASVLLEDPSCDGKGQREAFACGTTTKRGLSGQVHMPSRESGTVLAPSLVSFPGQEARLPQFLPRAGAAPGPLLLILQAGLTNYLPLPHPLPR